METFACLLLKIYEPHIWSVFPPALPLTLSLSTQCAAALNLKRPAVHVLVLKQALLKQSTRKINSMQIVADSARKLELAFND